jgi:predicted nucleic acid-binding Zn ribbon protein
MRNARGQAKTEAEFYRSNPLQRCQICGKLFVKRAEKVCSRECLEKLEEQLRPKPSPH